MRPPKKRHPLLAAFLVFLLAVVCICAAELAACRVEAPETYEKITAPVISFAVNTWERAADLCANTWRQAKSGAAAMAERLVELIPQKKPETPQEASDEPAIVEELEPADPTITEFQTEEGREVLTGGGVLLNYYNQKDDAWAEKLFGKDPIGKYGCGPTALSMLVTSLTGEELDPAQMSDWAAKAGHWARRSGSYLSIVEGAARQYGLDCTSLSTTDPEELLTSLSGGGIAVALMGPGHFTKGGHFILIHGVTLSGGVLVADPNSRDNSLVVWDPQLILDELSPSRTNGAPLWMLSVPSGLETE